MSRNAAKRNSTLAREKHAASRSSNSKQNWQNVKIAAETAIRFEAGVVCVDLDSVILFHSPEMGNSHLGRVLSRGRDLVNLLSSRWRVVVLTARPERQHQQILLHLAKHGVWVERVTNRKPYADAYFDDKAIRIPKNWR